MYAASLTPPAELAFAASLAETFATLLDPLSGKLGAPQVATAGVAEAAVPLIVMGAQRLVKSLVMDLEQHLIGQVIEAAAKPLFAKVEVAVASLDWSASGSGGSTRPVGNSVAVDPDVVGEHIVKLRSHAATMRDHGVRFQRAVAELGF